MTYRTDPEWLAAQADYVGEHPELNPSERLLLRNDAINRMHLIETGNRERIAALLRAGGVSA